MSIQDPRFARLATDPRFIRPSKASQKVVLDERFKNLLSDNDANDDQLLAKVDKYGRRVSKDKQKRELRAFYRLDDATSKGADRARGEGLFESSNEEDSNMSGEEKDVDVNVESEEESGDEEVLLGSKQARDAIARRRRASSELSIDLNEETPIASTSTAGNARVESTIPTMEKPTSRIAIVNLDWDNVRAIDLFKVFDSVLSPSASGLANEIAGIGSRKSKTKIGKGRVESVKIYTSDFGKARLAREEKEGPPVEIFRKAKETVTSNATKLPSKKRRIQEREEADKTSEDESGEDYDEQALRRYQLERLRYYYAVVEFDTISASQHAYIEIDGTEFEATANVFDLRYVPDETALDDSPSDAAMADTLELQMYKPVDFVTDALRNSKVKLTWDADDPQRAKITRATHAKTGKDEDVDYSALLASDSEDEKDRGVRMRAAFGLNASGVLEGADEMEEEEEMEITFAPALSGSRGIEEEGGGEKEETSLEAYQRKDRERRQARKEKKKAEKKKLSGGRTRLTHEEEGDSDPDEAFDANDLEEAAGDDENGQDGFFELSSGVHDDEREINAKQLSNKAAKQLEKARRSKEAEALSLLVGDDDENALDDGKHFDMQAILKAEKVGSKPKKILKKGKDRRKHREATELLAREKDRFQVDLKDDRFKSLHEDYEFALDPSNPRYMKTKNMERLLEENRLRRNTLNGSAGKSLLASNDRSHSLAASQPIDGLSSLVKSIKRKSKKQKQV